MSTDEIQAILIDLSALSHQLHRALRQVTEIEKRLNRAVPDDVRTWAEADTLETTPMAPPPLGLPPPLPPPDPPVPVPVPLAMRLEVTA